MISPSLEPETILPGITRSSVIELARKELGMEVIEQIVTLNDLQEGTEAFCCGTGASITPVASVTTDNPDGTTDMAVFGDGKEPGPTTRRLYEILQAIQTGSDPDLSQKYAHWIHTVCP